MADLAPLVVFVYKRLDYTIQTLSAVNDNFLAKDTEIFIYSDGPKTENDRSKVEEVRRYIRDFSKSCNFKAIHVKESEKNRGLADSIIGGVTEILQKYGKAIVLEDDLVTAKEFLNFMNDCLDYYKDNQKVWSIGGTTFALDSLKEYEHDVYACYRGSSWGWATWYDRWEKVDWSVSDYRDFMKDWKRRRRFKRGGQDMVAELKRQRRGEIDAWAIRWCYQESKDDMVTILPVQNLVRNIGWGGDATHCDVDRFHTCLGDKEFVYSLENVDISENLMRDFRKYYTRPLVNRILDYIYIRAKKLIHIRKNEMVK